MKNPPNRHNPLSRLRDWYQSRFGTALPPEIRDARALIAAIDAGGIPLNPLRVNAIARALGLEISRKAPVDETIARIRAALDRQASRPR